MLGDLGWLASISEALWGLVTGWLSLLPLISTPASLTRLVSLLPPLTTLLLSPWPVLRSLSALGLSLMSISR